MGEKSPQSCMEVDKRGGAKERRCAGRQSNSSFVHVGHSVADGTLKRWRSSTYRIIVGPGKKAKAQVGVHAHPNAWQADPATSCGAKVVRREALRQFGAKSALAVVNGPIGKSYIGSAR
eukprot:882981-Amphidinium_carterae.1